MDGRIKPGAPPGVSSFNELSDVDQDYTGDGGKYLKVKATEDGIEYAALAGGGDMAAATYDPRAITADVFDADNHTDGSTNKVYTATEKTKLSGIEAAADVTDADNVATAGAVMDADFTAADEIMVGTGAGTHSQVTLAASQFLAKKAAGTATNVTATEARTILNVADGADVTGSNAPQAHKDSHDPNDGSDPLDTANAAEIASVQAAGTGTSHSLARADHAHAINHGITDNHILTVDDAAAADDELCRFTANGIEGITNAVAITQLLSSALPEDVLVLLDAAVSADGKYSGIGFTGTAGVATVFGEAYYLAVADSKWEKAKGDAEATTSPLTAICCGASAENGTSTFLYAGTIREDDWDWTVGAPVFISAATAGALTQTELTTGQYQKCIGCALDANTIMVVPQVNWVKVG